MSFYIRYSKETGIPDSLSGQPITNIPEDFAVATISDEDGHEFMSGKLSIGHHRVIGHNGHAILKHMHIISNDEKSALSDGIIHDLDYRASVFTGLEIHYSYINGTLTVMKYARALPENTFYITKYRDSRSLLTKVLVSDFEKDNQFKINYDGKISVWA
jgi:hypothetical protein